MPSISKSIKNSAKNNGLLLGLFIVVVTVGAYALDWDIFLSPWFQFSKFIIVMVLGIRAVAQPRRLNPPKFTFRDGFSAFFITAALGLFIFIIANWVLFDLIDSDAGHYISETSIDMQEERLKELDRDEEEIKETVTDLRGSYQFGFLNQIRGYFINLVLYCIPAALVAVVFKKKKPIITK